MLVLPAAIGTFLLVNLLCACIALGVGFAAGVWFFGAKMAKPADQDAKLRKPAAKQAEDAKRTAERAAMAASHVADLAQSVASDVGDHAAKMKAISADLAGIDRQSAGANAAVFSAMDQMLAANTELQQRLEQAEKQLATQAAEIKAHESEARTDSLTGLSQSPRFRRRAQTPPQRMAAQRHALHARAARHRLLQEVQRHARPPGRRRSATPGRQGARRAVAARWTCPAATAARNSPSFCRRPTRLKACIVAERIRAAIEASTTVCDGKIAQSYLQPRRFRFPRDDDVARLIRRADDALYASKKAGRNCGHWNTGTKHVPITTPEEQVTAAEDEPPPTAAELRRRTPESRRANRRNVHSNAQAPRHRKPSLRHSDLGAVLEDRGIRHRQSQVRQSDRAANGRCGGPGFQKVLREMDVMAKLENGEFVVMLPGSTQTEVSHVVKRMRTASRQLRLAARRPSAADSLSPRRRRTQSRMRPRRSFWPAPAGRDGRQLAQPANTGY